jgi:hypothetical protein
MNASSQPAYPLSQHARSRCAQRSYRKQDLKLVLHYGTPTAEGVLMTERDVMEARADLHQKLRHLTELATLLKKAA